MNQRTRLLILMCIVGIGILIPTMHINFSGSQRIHELKVRITASTKLPDPAAIETNGEWYYLANVSSGLLEFDSSTKKYSGLLAESWNSQLDGVHTFKLKPGIRFHDGTPIRVKDVIWSIKRQVLLKTSDFFPFADYVVGCESIKTLLDECEGLKEISPNEFSIHIKNLNSSLYLELASPETGIWSADDMDPMTGKLAPTKFSGPYYLSQREDASALLLRNQFSPLSGQYPDSPESIRIKSMPLSEVDNALSNGSIDVAVRGYSPFGEKALSLGGFDHEASSPTTMIYLFGTGTNSHAAIGANFIEGLWESNLDPVLQPADSFLPTPNKNGLSKSEFLAEVPRRSAKHLRILCLDGFFSKPFLKQIATVGLHAGTKIEFIFVNRAEWFKAFEDDSAAKKYDFILSSYVASERYPAAQLRLLTDKYPNPPIDLKTAEEYGDTTKAAGIIKSYEKWLLRSGRVIPLYFNVTLLLHRKNIDVGQRIESDGDIAMWKFSKRNGR